MKDKGLESLFSKSLKYYVKKRLLLGQIYPDSRHVSIRTPADFWVISKNYTHHIECKEVTATNSFYFAFDRIYESGQYNELYNFWKYNGRTHSWVIISFKNRKYKVDRYYIIHINHFKLIHEWINKESIRLDEIEYFIKFEFPKLNNDRYVRINYDYNMKIEKISVDGVKGRILDLESLFIK